MKRFKRITVFIIVAAILTTGGVIFANETGVLDELKAQRLEQKSEIINQKVEEGILTQEKADEILSAIEESMLSCDGTGSKGIGRELGAGFGLGKGAGVGKGTGLCDGTGQGNESGCGEGLGSRNGMGRGAQSGQRMRCQSN